MRTPILTRPRATTTSPGTRPFAAEEKLQGVVSHVYHDPGLRRSPARYARLLRRVRLAECCNGGSPPKR
eukprot:6449757-Lingulodinium_polyedra.AAC.1